MSEQNNIGRDRAAAGRQYKALHQTAGLQMDALRSAIETHRFGRHTWDKVGDMSHVTEKLGEILDFIGGKP